MKDAIKPPSPRVVKNSIISRIRAKRGEITFALASLLTPTSSLISSLITTKVLTPGELGTISSIGLLPTYLAFLQIGVFSGLSRNLPLELGAQQFDKAHRLNRASATFSLYIAIVAAFICLIFGVFEAIQTGVKSLSFWAFAATASAAFAGPITLYVDTALRGLGQFGALSKSLIWTSVITVASTSLVYTSGAWGAIARIVLCALIPMCIRMSLVTTYKETHLDLPALKELIVVGTPLMISGTFFSLLLASDRSIVAAFMDKEDVGMFTLASLVVNSLQVIPQSISMIMFPMMAKHFGRNNSRPALRKFLLQSLGLNLITLVPASLVCYVSLPPLVEHVFPAYREGIPAARIACITCLLWIYMGVNSIIGVTNRMRPYLVAMGLALALIWVLGYYAVMFGYGIVGVAWARFIGTALLCCFTIGYSWHLTIDDNSRQANDV